MRKFIAAAMLAVSAVGAVLVPAAANATVPSPVGVTVVRQSVPAAIVTKPAVTVYPACVGITASGRFGEIQGPFATVAIATNTCKAFNSTHKDHLLWRPFNMQLP